MLAILYGFHSENNFWKNSFKNLNFEPYKKCVTEERTYIKQRVQPSKNYLSFNKFCCHYPLINYPAPNSEELHCPYGHDQIATIPIFNQLLKFSFALDSQRGVEMPARYFLKKMIFTFFIIITKKKSQ